MNLYAIYPLNRHITPRPPKNRGTYTISRMGNITPNDGTPGNTGTPGSTPNAPNAPDTPNTPDTDGHKKPASMDPAVLDALNEHAAALRSEFEITNATLSANSEPEDLKSYFKKHVADSAAQIVWLSMHAFSESVKLNANKYIIAEAFAETGSDELSEILNKLTESSVK